MQASHSARAALDRFFISVEKRAFFRAKLALGNEDDAIEIVQEAMLTLVERYAAKPEAEWCYLFNKVLETKIIDWHRRQKMRNRWQLWLEALSTSSSNKQDANDSGANLIDLAEDKSNLESVKKLMLDRSIEACLPAIEALPLRQQQAFLLRQWEGLSVKESASVMQCSEGSVKTHLSRALQQLRTAITEYSHE